MPDYDIIGDVHGNATKLHGLLERLGWRLDADGVRRHVDPNRQAIFVGDLVDRGGEQRDTLETVKAMVDHGTALIVMGNHEFNAISLATDDPDKPGSHLRPHTTKNLHQSAEFLGQLTQHERDVWVRWFRTLPIWLDLGDLRVVHACWHQESVALLEREFGGNRFPDGISGFVRANDRRDEVWAAIEVLLKGPEVELEPYGLPAYNDKDGHPRHSARARWWNSSASLLGDLIDIPGGTTTESDDPYPAIPDVKCLPHDRTFSYSDPVPVVYGHHWRQWTPEEHLDWTARTACVDFSAGSGGPLVAYQWRGEAEIDPTHYVAFGAAQGESSTSGPRA